MARAIVEGWLRAGAVAPEDICAVAKRYDRLRAYAEETGIRAEASIRDVVRRAEAIVIAVKPDTVPPAGRAKSIEAFSARTRAFSTYCRTRPAAWARE